MSNDRMLRSCAPIAATLLVAGYSTSVAPAAHIPLDSLTISGAQRRSVHRVQRDIIAELDKRQLSRRISEASAIEGDLANLCLETACTDFTLTPVFPVGSGVLVDAAVMAGQHRVELGRLYTAPNSGGVWRISDNAPRTIRDRPATVENTVNAFIDPIHGEFYASVDMTVLPEGEPYLVFDMFTSSSVVVKEVTQRGTPLRFRRDGQLLVVELARDETLTVLHFEYGGRLDKHDQNRITSREVLLYNNWVPYIGGAGNWTIALELPDTFTLLAPAPGSRHGTRPGFAVYEYTAHAMERFPIIGSSHIDTRRSRNHGINLSVSSLALPARVDEVESAASSALEALSEFGQFPAPHYAIVVGAGTLKWKAFAFDGMVIAGRDLTESDALPIVIAHEMAHAWFGTAVKDHSFGRWSEVIASYLSMWALAPPAARKLREKWLNAYADLPVHRDVPIAGFDPMPKDPMAVEAIFYSKGALILTALENRIGHAGMVRFLSALTQAHKGEHIGWPQVIGVLERIAGKKHAQWLSRWLEHTKRRRTDWRAELAPQNRQ